MPSSAPATLGGRDLAPYYHACAFVRGRDEWYNVLGSFFKEGIDCGDKCLHVVNAADHPAHVTDLGQLGIDTESCLACGQLQILSWEETYLVGGSFDPDRMIAKLEAEAHAAEQTGYLRVRIMGEMAWALGDAPGRERLVEYEARVNETLRRYELPAVCVYDINKLSAAMMMDILRTHPLTLVGSVVQENPFYTPAEQLLPQLRKRADPN